MIFEINCDRYILGQICFQISRDNSILYNIFQMNINSTIFFAWLLFITYSAAVDQLSNLQSNFVTAASSGTNVLKLGANSYQITYATAFTGEPPRAFPVLCQFSSSMTTTYDVNVKISGLTTSKFTLQITTGSNWNSLSYSILSLPGAQITLVAFQLKDLGINSNKAAITKTKDIGELVSKSDQTVVKFDVFITGFKLTVSDASSNFFLNTSINYGAADITNSKYDKYNDYIYELSATSGFPSGIAVTQTSVSLSLNWFGDLSSLQMTFISHTVVLSPIAANQFTGGYNTISVTKSNYNIPLIDPNKNKNNLGSLNTASFYGFTCININPVRTVDANISLLYSYLTNVTSSGSTINSLSASYYFYQKLEDQIVDYKFNQVIDAQFDATILKALIPTAYGLNQYYNYFAKTVNGKVSIVVPKFVVKSGIDYLMTSEILTPAGCYSGTSPTIQLYMNFSQYDSQALKTTNKPAENYFVNPYQPCTSTNVSQFSTPVQKMFRYFKIQITASTQYTGAIISFNGGDLNIFIKNLKVYKLSSNVTIDPMITEVTISSFQNYYNSTQSSQINFTVQIPKKTFQNAIIMTIQKSKPVILQFVNSVVFKQGVNYTLSLYLLDSAGNLSSFFGSPTFLSSYKIDSSIDIMNQAATLSKPFCSSAFNATSPLIIPVDLFYLRLNATFVTSSSSPASVSFTLSDQSTSDHMYALRGISIKHIQYFDPIARNNVLQCPQNTYLTNTIPPACQPCYVQNKIDNGSKCLCPSNTFQNSFAVCIQCSYSCYNCSSLNKCTSCPTGRTFDATLLMCNCTTTGFYDDGVNTACAKCDQTCGSCSGNAYNCTSCPNGSVLDTTTSACICGAGYFNDSTTRCGKCTNKCGNCSGNANKCTSCLNETGSTFDPTTSTCKCKTGYSFSSSGNCTKNNPIYIPNFHPQQFLKTFILKAFLTAINNSTLNVTDILNTSSCILFYNQSRRKLDSQNLTLNIVQIILLPNNLVQFIVQNPSFDIINTKVLLNINNPNINQTSIQFTISQLYSAQTMSSISSSTSSSVTSTVLLTILLFIMLIFYVLGYKHNHTISFIQKISFLRFNLPITSSTFAFLYSLKYSYYAYGVNALQSLLSQNYLQNSNGNFYFVDQDANILRNVGIPILFSITIILLRLIGLLLFKSSQQTTSSKKYYYRAIEYIQKTIMFPIIFFGIAEMTFANMYKKSDTADPSIYNSSLAFSVIYVIYFGILVVATGFSKQISNYAKLELVGEYLFSIFDSIIIIQTYYTNNLLTLIITIIVKCIYELFLKYFYASISKLDLMKVIVTAFEIALIGILSNSSTSLSSIQALFIIVVVIDLLYVLGTTILKDKKKKQEEVPIETLQSNKEVVNGQIPIVDTMNTINP